MILSLKEMTQNGSINCDTLFLHLHMHLANTTFMNSASGTY